MRGTTSFAFYHAAGESNKPVQRYRALEIDAGFQSGIDGIT